MTTIHADLTDDERIILALALLNLRTRLRRDIILATQAGALTAVQGSEDSVDHLHKLVAKLGMEDMV